MKYKIVPGANSKKQGHCFSGEETEPLDAVNIEKENNLQIKLQKRDYFAQLEILVLTQQES